MSSIFDSESDEREGIAFLLELYSGFPRIIKRSNHGSCGRIEMPADDCEAVGEFHCRDDFVSMVNLMKGNVTIFHEDRVPFAGPYLKKFRNMYARILLTEDYFRSVGEFDYMYGSADDDQAAGNSSDDGSDDESSQSSKKRRSDDESVESIKKSRKQKN